MPAYPSFDDNTLAVICDVLAETSNGLTGSELGALLTRMGIGDPEPSITKRKRLYLALRQKQARDHCANNVLAFIQEAMAPVRYTQRRELFETRRNALNIVLALAGYQLGEDGRLQPSAKVRTLSDAEASGV
jgi:hypothetical protein